MKRPLRQRGAGVTPGRDDMAHVQHKTRWIGTGALALLLPLLLLVMGCDNFFAATVVPPYTWTTSSKTNIGAGTQSGEPAPCGTIGSTLWATFTATATEPVAIDTIGSDFNTVVAVYSGPLTPSAFSDLTLVGCNDDYSGLQSGLPFSAVSGTTYFLQFGGAAGAQGHFVLHFSEGPLDPASTLTVNSANDVDDGTCDATHCSLREAINASNSMGGQQTIRFNIPTEGSIKTIPVGAGGLPAITDAVTIDGTTQPAYGFTTGPAMFIELNGTGAGAGTDGLTITAGGSTVEGLAINRFGGNGIHITGASAGSNTILNNYIGTNILGTAGLGNTGFGVRIDTSASSNTIGGTTAPVRNVISANVGGGVDVSGGAASNTIEGNYIGTSAGGGALTGDGNHAAGVVVSGGGSGNTIGGTVGTTPGGSCTGACNVISGNTPAFGGVVTLGTIGVVVQGNYIGLAASGAGLGNGGDGIFLSGGSGNLIGGTTAAARNVISSNTLYGIGLSSGATGNQVLGNFIGTDAAGTAARPNTRDGVVIDSGAADNAIGSSAGRNTIAFNGWNGICVTGTPMGNAIRANSIFSNVKLGIDLDDGAGCTNGVVTGNDAAPDADTGPNNLQNFPALSSAESNGVTTTVISTLASTASTSFTIDYFSNTTCDPSGNGQGKKFLGSLGPVWTDGSGNILYFTKSGLPPVTLGEVVTATATRNTAPLDTSEFSACATVAAPSGDDSDGDGVPDDFDNCWAWPNPSQAMPPWSVPADDPDCDGFPSAVQQGMRGPESFMGTDSTLACARTTTPNDERGPAFGEPLSPWPMDNNDDRKAGLADVLAYIPVYLTNGPGLPYKARYDLDANNKVGLSDILAFIPFYLTTCTP